MTDPSAAERILDAIRAIPRGETAAYGVVAQRAGLPGRARRVARLRREGVDIDAQGRVRSRRPARTLDEAIWGR
jgi:alkylated DNA nucleotide flippase Atl1